LPNVSLENVTFETRRVSLVYRHAHYRSKMSRLRHAVYRWCIVTLIIAHVSLNVSLENVTFETRRVSLCIVTLVIAHVSLNFMARISLMSRYDFWYGYFHSADEAACPLSFPGIPSEKAWGKKKKVYYDADQHKGKDLGKF
jgi:hypothetical protein